MNMYKGDFLFTIGSDGVYLSYNRILVRKFDLINPVLKKTMNIQFHSLVKDVLYSGQSNLNNFAFENKIKNFHEKLIEFYQYIMWDKESSQKWFLAKFISKQSTLRLREKLIHELRYNPDLSVLKVKNRFIWKYNLSKEYDRQLILKYDSLINDKYVKKELKFYETI